MSKPKILISADVHRKVMFWVNKSKYEVSGLGTIKIQPNGDMLVTSAILLKQQNTSTHTEITAESVCKAMFDLRTADGELKWWWHSHVQMGVFWSGTDMDTIKELGKQGWIAATVFNQKNELRSAVYAHDSLVLPWKEKPSYVFYDECETAISVLDDPRTAEWEKEYEEKVTNASVFTQARSREWPGKGATYDHKTGTWIPKDGTASTTGTAAGTGGISRKHLFIYEKYTPGEITGAIEAQNAGMRPFNMTKKDWHGIRQLAPSSQQSLIAKSTLYWGDYGNSDDAPKDKAVDDVARDIDDAVSRPATAGDEFGLDGTDWEILTLGEYTKDDVKFLVEDADFSPAELLMLANTGTGPQEVRYMLAHGYTQAGIVKLANETGR